MKLLFLILFVFVDRLTSADEFQDGDSKVTYQFNHPPTVETYNPIIDVAVVYDDTNINTQPSTTEKVKTTEKVEQTTVSAKDETVKPTLVPKARALQDIQIPVAVVYESEESSRNQSVSRPKVIRRRLKQRQQQKPKETKDVVTEQNALNIPVPTAKTYVPVVPTDVKSKTTRERDPVVPIIDSENHVYAHNGNFQYSYEGGDGTRAFSEGRLMSVDGEAAGEAVVGGFSYTDKEGNDFSLTYTADENGYRPVGAHLPTPPPIPPAIARALAYLATVTTPEPVTKPSKDN